MCGIFGIVRQHDVAPSIDADRFQAALATLNHRGPDGRHDVAIDDVAHFGHTRLAIIDLSDDSRQPFTVDGRFWLTYNGEIFNYIELREELEQAGISFVTAGDTEVVLRAFIHWGEACVQRFNGMWAFAIWDQQQHTLFASRDRFGIKPFHYALIDGQLLFASEIKAILSYCPDLAEPDLLAIANFCRSSVGAQHDRTWFTRVNRLMPAHNLHLAAGQLRIERYWNYPAKTEPVPDFDEAAAAYRRLFEDAVAIRMRSDVPVGITLSAGLDSASIAFAMKATTDSAQHAFTSRFEDKEALSQSAGIYASGNRPIDEAAGAARIAADIGIQQHVVMTDYSDFVGELAILIRHLESGNSAPPIIPLMQLLREARRHVTVVMEGQGADELLAGYVTTLVWQDTADRLGQGRWREAWRNFRAYRQIYTVRVAVLMGLRKAANRIPAILALQQRWRGISAVFGPLLRGQSSLADFPATPAAANEDRVATALRHQHSGGLVNLLHYGDAVSMANSLESRLPFLDHRLVEYVWQLPADYKLKLGVGKRIHRAAMHGLVPDHILNDPVKFGFPTPIDQQFRKRWPPDKGPIDVLMSETCLNRGLFDRDGLGALIAAHQSGKQDHGPLLFRLLSTELWFRHFIDPHQKQASHD